MRFFTIIKKTNKNHKVINHHRDLVTININAAWEASYNYFNILSSRGDIVYRVMGPPNLNSGQLGRHGVYGCQIPTVVAFLELYISK